MINSHLLNSQISKYQIVEELGKGGMGAVYKAFAPQMDTFVALKVILKVGDRETQRFIREARAMAKINHPNIVKIYDIGMAGNFPYFTMTYIKGTSLKSFIKNTPLNIRLFLNLIVKISKAITYAHELGIIHRDIKPANVMLDKNKEPYILDFGLAKTLEDISLSAKGTILGTPKYMSPQQARGEKVDRRTDVYALGAILYEMLAGKPLVDGENVAGILYKVIHKEPDLLRSVNNKLARDLETICHKSVAKELSKRYQSVQEFSEDIERFLHGQLIQARAASIWEKIWHKLYKNKLMVVVIMLGISLTVITIWIFEKHQNIEIEKHLAKAEKWQQLVDRAQTIGEKMQIYMKISIFLERSLERSANDFTTREKLINVLKTMGILAKEQKNYLLSFFLFKQCKNLGYKKANELLEGLEEQKKQQEKEHRLFISKIMEKVSQNTPQDLMDRHIFTIVKMQKPYVVKALVPYLKKNNKWQKLVAIRALGKLGNGYTKFKGKDSVQWLLDCLKKFQNKETIESNQREVEEIIWSLGWLKDKRANSFVFRLRWLTGQGSLLWGKTKIPYKWIPIEETSPKTVEQFIIRGNMKREKGDYPGAIANYNQAISLNPKSSLAYNNLGSAYLDIGEYGKTIVNYDQAIALNPKYTDSYNNRALACSNLGEYGKAIADYNQAIALNPKASEIYNNRGNVYQRTKEYSKAIADYNQAIILNPTYSEAYANRGLVYKEIGKYSKAIADHNQAIALNPMLFGVYTNRGLIYKEIREYNKAIADYNQAIALNPKSSEAYHNRGVVYENIKEYSKAIADYTQAIALDPKSFKTYSNRGIVYQNIKKYKKAIADHNRAIALNPKSFKAYNNRGIVYKYTREYSKAIVDYTQAIALNPKYINAYYNRANIYQNIKKYYKAIADYSRVIVLDPKDLSAYYNRGSTYQSIKEYHKAIADYSQVLAFNPRFALAYIDRGGLYLSLKKYQEAYQDFRMFLKLAPKHPIAPKIYAIINNLKRNNLISK